MKRLVYDIGRVCLMDVGYKSRWWARCSHVCVGLWELVNLLWLKNINKEGTAICLELSMTEMCGRRLWGENPGG